MILIVIAVAIRVPVARGIGVVALVPIAAGVLVGCLVPVSVGTAILVRTAVGILSKVTVWAAVTVTGLWTAVRSAAVTVCARPGLRAVPAAPVFVSLRVIRARAQHLARLQVISARDTRSLVMHAGLSRRPRRPAEFVSADLGRALIEVHSIPLLAGQTLVRLILAGLSLSLPRFGSALQASQPGLPPEPVVAARLDAPARPEVSARRNIRSRPDIPARPEVGTRPDVLASPDVPDCPHVLPRRRIAVRRGKCSWPHRTELIQPLISGDIGVIIGPALLALPPHCHLHADTSTGQRLHARRGLATCLPSALTMAAGIRAHASIVNGR
ncbi:MAG: hypothetical protein ACLQFR_09375 [Streptosporangiaceae bacterium]